MAMPTYMGLFLTLLLSAVGGNTAFADFAPPALWVNDFGRVAGGWQVANHPRMLADVNNDGRADVVGFGDGGAFVSLSTGTGFTPPALWVNDFGRVAGGWQVANHPRMLADVNSDGRADVVGFGDGGAFVSLSTGTGFTPPALWVNDFGRLAGGWQVANHPRMLADVNGDGRADVVGFGDGGAFVSLSTGTGFTPPALWVNDFGRLAGGWQVANHPRMLADVNNDGRADVVGFGDGGAFASLSTGTGFTPPALWVNDFGRLAGGWQVANHPRMLADVNNDGRADVVGFGDGGAFASLSTGTGFTPPALWVNNFGRLAGGWQVANHPRMLADVNGDGRADVVGFGDDGAFASLSTGTGFTPPALWVNNFGRLAGGWQVANHPRMLADVNGDGRADVVGFGDDGAFVSLSTGVGTQPKPGEVAVAGLEVTQAVQDMAYSVGLVANKRTVARVYLDINASSPITVSGELLVWRPLPAPGFTRIVVATGNAVVDPARNGQLRAQRENLTASLNFVLPPETLGNGYVVVRLLNVRAATSGAAVGCSNCTTSTRAALLQDTPPLRVRVLGLSYPFGIPPVTQAPRALDFDLIASWLRRAYPTGQVQIAQLTIPATPTWPFVCTQANAQVAAVRNVDVNVNNSVDARTHYYGLVFNGGGFMRGCSAVPSTPDPSAVGSGPTGIPGAPNSPAGSAWDLDGSFGDWYTGHELGHSFGRPHLGSGCGDVPADPGYPFPAGQLSGADGAFVGFDVGDPAAGLPMAALPGTVWHDVMSYCVNQWISSYTHRGIRNRLIDEDVLPPGAPSPGTVVTAGAPQTELGRTPALGARSSEPSPEVVVGGEKQPSPGNLQVAQPPPRPEGGPAPVAPATPATIPPRVLEAQSTEAGPLPERDSDAGMQPAGTATSGPDNAVTPEMRAALERQQQAETARATEAGARELPGVEVREGDFVNVVVTVNATKNTGSIAYVNRVSRALVPSQSALAATPAEAEIRAVDANGRILVSQPAQIRFDSDKEPFEDRTGLIDTAIPVPLGAAAIEVLLSGRVVTRREVGGNLPTAGMAGEQALEVTPIVGATGRELVLDWSTAGVAPADVTYIVLASTDGGVSWQTLAVGLHEPKLRIDAGQFGGGRLQLRVIATNGLQNVEVANRVVETR